MATRTQARESVIGLLYAYDLGNDGITKFVDEILEEKKIRNNQKDFALNLFNGTIKNLSQIDENIVSNLNQGTLSDIGSVEKSILRLAIYEILFESLPKAIIINEAIELSKRLASDGAPKFINGLLDKIVKA
ncbi:transcription antitermination factor NusB [Aliarcobacter butzleri]|uniref:Transcription antitermination protein NusB n=6 Tax=root TaxID=1 RepID=NUSB_ALIB4|nr:transcription antitermination factor NusB [Aliarcobacter butzleri]A8EVW4.1 RecName: Full=Transcription antitermination protein NusB; AltName: Full=Antitermination factor NusB [Aliarcobacter butzleri RM4018]MCP3650319.1 transcription antitermination factor NusB [Arcobacter sp. DNRA7]ABV68087.1 transcription termination factor NusB [Aliarcobacter butzleri RM4018]EFU69980.1 transcription antitermination factor NusB [Aliarcobacter butzleri JV22]KLD98848.1 transcription antitermination protein N